MLRERKNGMRYVVKAVDQEGYIILKRSFFTINNAYDCFLSTVSNARKNITEGQQLTVTFFKRNGKQVKTTVINGDGVTGF